MPAPPPPPPRRARGPAGPPDATPATGQAAPPPPPRRTPPPDGALAGGAAASETTTRTATATAATGTAVHGGPTRTERQRAARAGGSSGGGKRRGVVIGVIVAVIVLGIGAAFALGVFSGGSDSASAPDPSTDVDLNRGEVDVYFAGAGESTLSPEVEDAVMAAIGEYVNAGIVPTLRGEQLKPTKLGGAFDAAAIARFSSPGTPDREVLFDEGVPKAIGKLTLVADSIELRALNDFDNKTIAVSARFGLDVSGRSKLGKAGRFEITHEGELVLEPDTTGTWKITSWDLAVERAGAGFPTPLTPPTTVAETKTADTGAATTTTEAG